MREPLNACFIVKQNNCLQIEKVLALFLDTLQRKLTVSRLYQWSKAYNLVNKVNHLRCYRQSLILEIQIWIYWSIQLKHDKANNKSLKVQQSQLKYKKRVWHMSHFISKLTHCFQKIVKQCFVAHQPPADSENVSDGTKKQQHDQLFIQTTQSWLRHDTLWEDLFICGECAACRAGDMWRRVKSTFQ